MGVYNVPWVRKASGTVGAMQIIDKRSASGTLTSEVVKGELCSHRSVTGAGTAKWTRTAESTGTHTYGSVFRQHKDIKNQGPRGGQGVHEASGRFAMSRGRHNIDE
jgi:hypothetical protein